MIPFLLGNSCARTNSIEAKQTQEVQRQQSQYAKGQPVPAFDWSLERHLLIELYRVRNAKVATHSVWRADYGMIEGDCPSYGYGMPYDSSLTNPLMATDEDPEGYDHQSLVAIEQAEPNGIFASKNTAATWVMCLGQAGNLEPIYVETKVTVYPGPVKVDYDKNRVTRSGAATVLIPKGSGSDAPAPAAAEVTTPITTLPVKE
jgi:hypothetical protein